MRAILMHFSTTLCRKVNFERLRWAGDVVRMGIQTCKEFWQGDLLKSGHFEDRGLDAKVMLNLVLRK
jgi:hypothetical protein